MSTDRYKGWSQEQLRAEYDRSVAKAERLLRVGMFLSVVGAVFAVIALVAKLCGH